MKILFVIDSLGSGGAQRQMVNLALGLQQRGHIVELFIYHPHYDFYMPMIESAKISIHECQKKRRFDPRVVIALRAQIAHGRYDAALSFLDTPNLYCELACLGMKSPSLVVAERSSYPVSGPSLYKRLLEHFHHLADAIVVNSYFQARRMLQFAPWTRGKLQVIYNGLDPEIYSAKREAPQKLGALLAVGSVNPSKNVTGAARALVAYKAMYGDPPRIDWVGAVHSSRFSQMEYEATRTILRVNGLENNWGWLGERRDLYSLYPMYAALLHPSFHEGLPNVVCEAMACGLPVLLSDFGEHPRLVDKGAHGIIFNPHSPEDIARAIHEFVQLGEQEQHQMGDAARRFAEREFAMDISVGCYEQLFLSLNSGGGRAAGD